MRHASVQLLCTLALAASLAAAPPPPLPSSFHGTVTLAGQPVPVGSTVSAWLGETLLCEAPVFAVGADTAFILDVPGDVPETPDQEGALPGSTLRFEVSGAAVPQSAIWSFGSYERLDLTAQAGPDLAVALDDGTSATAPGATLTYTVTLSNLGPGVAPGAAPHLTLAAGTTFVSATGAGAFVDGAVVWPAADLVEGGSVTVTATVAVASPAAAAVESLVAVATSRRTGSAGLDPQRTNDVASDIDVLLAAPDLGVTIDDGVAELDGDALVEYVVRVENRGDQDANSVVVTAIVPGWLTFYVASDHGNLGEGGVVGWPAVNLAAGTVLERRFKVRTPAPLPAAEHELLATASVGDDGSGGPDAAPADNAAEDRDALRRLPDLAVPQVDATAAPTDPDTLVVGGTVTVELANLGNLDAPATRLVVFEDRDLDGRFGSADLLLGEASADVAAGASAPLVVAVAGELSFLGNRLLAAADADAALAELDETNNLGSAASACGPPSAIGAFSPVVELSWPPPGGPAVEPESLDAIGVPLVVSLTDDDGDGTIDERDIPDIVFMTGDVENAETKRVLRAIRGDSGAAIWNVPDVFSVSGGFVAFNLTGQAAGDLDGDGKVEIVIGGLLFGIPIGSPPTSRLIAYEHTGQRKWISPAYTTRAGGASTRDNPTIADLDGDGWPEVVAGANVFDGRTGAKRWSGTGGQAFQSNDNDGSQLGGAISIVANLDLLGSAEMVTGNTVYTAAGAISWQVPYHDGYPAIGNFDADPFPEIVVVGHGTIRLHEHDGALVWGPFALPGTDPEAGGPPTIADFDGDGAPEIGVAGSDRYVVYEGDGSELWTRQTQDRSSNATGSTVFDFDGDGRFEVVYRDERKLRIYRGADGATLFETILSSNTHNEEPVIADVDGDGRAELLVTSDPAPAVGVPAGEGTRGLFVFGDAGDGWAAARRIWNQHAYHVGNVAEDGTVPAIEPFGWLEHNTYRAQLQPTAGALATPNLVASRPALDATAFPTLRLGVRVGNGGDGPARSGVSVAFYDGDPAAGGTLLGTARIPGGLVPGNFADVTVEVAAAGTGARTLVAVADDDGTGEGSERECDEADNRTDLSYELDMPIDLALAKSDGADVLVPGETTTYTLVAIQNGTETATGVAVADTLPDEVDFVSASDGGVLVDSVVTWPPFDLAPGASATRTVTVLLRHDLAAGVASFTNTAEAHDDGALGPDFTPANNHAADTNRVATVQADAGGPYGGDEGDAITFDASDSVDRDGTIVAYAWDLDGDGAFGDGSGVTASRSFPNEGSYTVAVRATDDSGEVDTGTATVTVRNAAPTVDAGLDRSAIEGDTVALAGVIFADAGTADAHTATIDWGDGSPLATGVVSGVGGTGSVAGAHSYRDDGVFEVSACVRDDAGDSACDSFLLTVANGEPIVIPVGTVDLRLWKAENLGSASWAVNAGGSSVTQNTNGEPTFFYSPFGAFGVRLTGTIVTTDSDDDYMGFALGFRPGDTKSSNADFLLVDWKGRAQTGARAGLALSRVQGAAPAGHYWQHTSDADGTGVHELARGLHKGSTGWVRGTTYTITCETTPKTLKVWVDGVLELDVTGEFSAGRLAFFNYSQARVTYGAFDSQNIAGEEGSPVVARARFTDVGLDDVHTATLEWGDGTTAAGSVVEAPGAGTVTGEHAYVNEGQFTLGLCAEDDDGGSGCIDVPVSILNVAPTVAAGPDRLTYAGELSTVEGVTFTDPGVLDTHTATVDWGDGSVTPALVSGVPGGGTVTAAHEYAANGTYAVEVCVTDDAGERGCDGFTWQRLDPVLDLTLSKTADRKFVRPNENVTYTLTLANAGTRAPRGVVLTDTLPAPLSFVSATDGGVWNAAARTITWTLGEVSYQQALTRKVVAKGVAAQPFGLPAVNTASVRDDGRFGPDATPENGDASAAVILWDGVTPFVDAGADREAVEGQSVALSASFFDSGTGEAHSATIDWGDGNVTAAAVSGTTTGTASGTHVYPDDGTFTVRACVTDAASHAACDEVAFTVANDAPQPTPLDVDLRTWSVEHYNQFTGDPQSKWATAADGLSVFQSINSRPSIFYGDFPAFGTRIKGTIRIEGTGDDDYVGFVLGYQPGDVLNADADFLLLDWKRAHQTGAIRGMALSRITGANPSVWDHDGEDIQMLARALNLGDTAWQRNTDYELTFELGPSRVRIWVNGILEFDLEGSFRNGRLGFYNYSQPGVRYKAFTHTATIVDEGSLVERTIDFGDHGVLDTHVATIDWADGTSVPGAVAFAGGVGTVSASHTYGDDGLYATEVCITDDEAASGCGTFPIDVNNVAPAVAGIANLATTVGVTLEAELATFTDPGVDDTHTAMVTWGDGTTTTAAVAQGAGLGTATGAKLYAAAGTYPVEVCVTDDDGGTGCAALTVTVSDPPILAATKTASLAVDGDGNGVPSPGDVVSWEIVVANSGNTATEVVVVDPLPAQTTLVAGSVAPSQGVVLSEGPVTVALGSLAGGSTATVRFAVTLAAVFPDGVDAVVNQATVDCAELPPFATDDPAQPGAGDPTVVEVAKAPVLVLTKTAALAADHDGDGAPSPGDELAYTLLLTNRGGSAATEIVVGDMPPAQTAVVAGSVVTDLGLVASESPVRVEIARLAVAETATIAFRVAVAATVPLGMRELSNQATSTSAQLPAVLSDDPALGGEADPTVTPIAAAPRLVAEKTAILAVDADGDGVASPGDTLAYQLSVRNVGNTSATGVVVRDAAPEYTTFVAGSLAASAGTVVSAEPVEVAVGELAAGDGVEVSFQVEVVWPLPTGVAEIVSQGLVESGGTEDLLTDDPAIGGPADPTVTPVVAAPMLAVEKTALLHDDRDGDGIASPGDLLLYRIAVENRGNTAATAVSLADALVPTLAIIPGSAQASHGIVDGEEPVAVTLGRVEAGVTAVVTFQAAIVDDFPPSELAVANQALVTSAELGMLPSDDPATPAVADATMVPVVITPVLALADVAVAESAGAATFTVSLSRASNREVRFGWATAPGTATAGTDYTTAAGETVIPPGETTATIVVAVADDTLDELDETYRLLVSDLAGADAERAEATASILDDDLPPELSIADVAVEESAGEARLTIALSAPTGFDVVLTAATVAGTASAGVDFGATAVAVAMPAGATIAQIVVPILDDPTDEPDETLTLVLADVAHAIVARGAATVAILDNDDPPALSVEDVTVDESAEEAVLTARLDRASGWNVTLQAATADGTAVGGADYLATVLDLVIPAGARAATLRVPLVADQLDEADETFQLDLLAIERATLARAAATATILDDDEPPIVTVSDVVADEESGEVRFALDLAAPSGLAVEVDVATLDGSALAGADYQAITATAAIPPGATTVEVVVPLLADLVDEADETFRLLLLAARNATLDRTEALATIVDDDVAALALADVTVLEGDAGTTEALVTATLTAAADHEVRFAWATVAGTASEDVDYEPAAGTVVLAPGETRATLAVPIVGDLLFEPETETVTVAASDLDGAELADASGVVTIRDDESCPSPNLLRNGSAEERVAGDGLPGWQAAFGTTWTRLSTTLAWDGSGVLAPLVVDSGATAELAQRVDVSAFAARIDGGGQRFAFRGALRTAVETPPDVAAFEVEYRDTIGVVLDGWSSGEVASADGWSVLRDERLAPPGTREVLVRLVARRFAGANADVLFDGLALQALRAPSLSVTDAAAYEGDAGTTTGDFRVLLSCAVAEPVSVLWATGDDLATASADYLATEGALDFAVGETSLPVAVDIVGDTLREPHETFWLELAGAAGATVADPLGIGTIVDDDFCARSHGFWKTHRELWPVDWLVVGGVEYDAAGMMALLSYKGGDVSGHLALQLVAAELDLLVGSDPAIGPTAGAAQELLSIYPPGSDPKGAARTEAEALKNTLDRYVNSDCSQNEVYP